jgi:hypothetical protein
MCPENAKKRPKREKCWSISELNRKVFTQNTHENQENQEKYI